jgi:hypothetical protein
MPFTKKTFKKKSHSNKKLFNYDPEKSAINNSLPFSLSPHPLWNIFWHEMNCHHWLMRTVSVPTVLSWSIAALHAVAATFVLSAVYEILGNKVLLCHSHYSYNICEANGSRFLGLLSMCRWDDNRSVCSSSATNNLSAAFLVTMIATVFYAPIVTMLEWCLCAVVGNVNSGGRVASPSSVQPIVDDLSCSDEVCIEEISRECEACVNIFDRHSDNDTEGLFTMVL